MRTAPRVLTAAAAAACASLAVWSAGAVPDVAASEVAPTAASTVAGPPAAPVPAAAPPVVVLDPGHNGRNAVDHAAANRPVPDGRGGTKACNTTGTETNAGYAEHAFTFDVAQRVRTKLAAAGVQVVLTRPDDAGVGPCVDERAAIGNRAAAAAVVSVHDDGSAAANHGFHVAYANPPLSPAQEGPARALAGALRDAMVGAGFPVAGYAGHEGLAGRPDLAGLNLSTRPTALIECGNMRNAGDAALATSAEGRERYASGIAAGILGFLGR